MDKKYYFVLCDSNGNGDCSNYQIVGPYTPDEVEEKYPYSCTEYEAGRLNGSPVYRYSESNCIVGGYDTFEEAYEYEKELKR